MITLITGQPGSGKTALAVDMLRENTRPLYVMGVPELQIPHVPTPPVSEWIEFRNSPEDPSIQLAYFTFEQNSLILLDEAQRVFRPRPVGSKVPPEVQAFETHRHTGVDFILITQSPGLIDPNIRKLIGRHIHVHVTPFGRRTFEWAGCGDPESPSSRSIAAAKKYKLPKKAFSLYKSSELHTKIKLAIPWYYYAFFAAVAFVAFASFYTFRTLEAKTKQSSSTNNPIVDYGASRSHSNGPAVPRLDYLSSLNPRVPGQYHTAPRYDEVTKPVDAPWPVGCVSRVVNDQKRTCRCIDQQGNNLAVPAPLCEQIVANGIFKDWQSPADQARNQQAQSFAQGAPQFHDDVQAKRDLISQAAQAGQVNQY